MPILQAKRLVPFTTTLFRKQLINSIVQYHVRLIIYYLLLYTECGAKSFPDILVLNCTGCKFSILELGKFFFWTNSLFTKKCNFGLPETTGEFRSNSANFVFHFFLAKTISKKVKKFWLFVLKPILLKCS